MRFLIDYFVLFIFGGVLAGTAAGILTMHPEDPGIPTLTAYAVMALSLCVLAGGHVLLMHREEDGKAPFWLVAITWALVMFAAFFVDVVLIVGVNLFRPGVIPDWAILIAFGFLGGSAAALACAAFAFTWGMHSKIMRRFVWATPWAAIRHLIKCWTGKL